MHHLKNLNRGNLCGIMHDTIVPPLLYLYLNTHVNTFPLLLEGCEDGSLVELDCSGSCGSLLHSYHSSSSPVTAILHLRKSKISLLYHNSSKVIDVRLCLSVWLWSLFSKTVESIWIKSLIEGC